MESSLIRVRQIEPAYRQVARQLTEVIVQGDLAPGGRLPSETELTTMFGVSRSTVREALRALSSQNLIVTQRGVKGGSFVARPSSADVSVFLQNTLGLLSGADAVSVDELVEARSILEVPAARLAAERRTEAHLAELWAAVEEEEQALTTGFERHVAMHSAVLRAAGNGLVEMMTEPIFTVLRKRFLRDHAPRRFWKQVAHDHRDIVERIADGDAEGAGDRMAAHLSDLRTLYRSIDRLRGPAADDHDVPDSPGVPDPESGHS